MRPFFLPLAWLVHGCPQPPFALACLCRPGRWSLQAVALILTVPILPHWRAAGCLCKPRFDCARSASTDVFLFGLAFEISIGRLALRRRRSVCLCRLVVRRSAAVRLSVSPVCPSVGVGPFFVPRSLFVCLSALSVLPACSGLRLRWDSHLALF